MSEAKIGSSDRCKHIITDADHRPSSSVGCLLINDCYLVREDKEPTLWLIRSVIDEVEVIRRKRETFQKRYMTYSKETYRNGCWSCAKKAGKRFAEVLWIMI